MVQVYNKDKKPQFDALIAHIKEAVNEVVLGAEVMMNDVYLHFSVIFMALFQLSYH